MIFKNEWKLSEIQTSVSKMKFYWNPAGYLEQGKHEATSALFGQTWVIVIYIIWLQSLKYLLFNYWKFHDLLTQFKIYFL